MLGEPGFGRVFLCPVILSGGEPRVEGPYPSIIYALLFVLGLLCSLLAGYRMADEKRSWLHILGFSVVTVIVVYVILDVEYPRAGFLQLDASDQFLVRVREGLR